MSNSKFTPKSLLTEYKLNYLVRQLKECQRLPGAIFEIGVYLGGSLERIRDNTEPKTMARVYGFDTFEGLPTPTAPDICPNHHWSGDFCSHVPFSEMRQYFERRYVHLRKCRFPEGVEDIPVAFAHIDVDLYEETKNCLEYLARNLLPGGLAVIDDYGWPQTPGVQKAVMEIYLGHYAFKLHAMSDEYQIVLQRKPF